MGSTSIHVGPNAPVPPKYAGLGVQIGRLSSSFVIDEDQWAHDFAEQGRKRATAEQDSRYIRAKGGGQL